MFVQPDDLAGKAPRAEASHPAHRRKTPVTPVELHQGPDRRTEPDPSQRLVILLHPSTVFLNRGRQHPRQMQLVQEMKHSELKRLMPFHLGLKAVSNCLHPGGWSPKVLVEPDASPIAEQRRKEAVPPHLIPRPVAERHHFPLLDAPTTIGLERPDSVQP